MQRFPSTCRSFKCGVVPNVRQHEAGSAHLRLGRMADPVVLIVDDNEDNRFTLSMRLAAENA
jgi:hypothetical protein